MTTSEIPEEAVERVASWLHGLEHDRLNSRCPGSDDCQLWYDAEFRAAALLPALPHLRVQETPHSDDCQLCRGLGGIAVHVKWSEQRNKPLWTAHQYPSDDPHPTFPCPYLPRPRPVVDREAPTYSQIKDAIRTGLGGDTEEGCGCESHICSAADRVLALLPTEDDTKALVETGTRLGYELGRKEAGEQIAAKIESQVGDGEWAGDYYRKAAQIARETSSQPPGGPSEPLTAHTGHSDLPEGGEGL